MERGLNLAEAASITQVDLLTQAWYLSWNLGIATLVEHLDRVLPVAEDVQHDRQVALDSRQPEAGEEKLR